MTRLRQRLAVFELVALATSLAVGLSRIPATHETAGACVTAPASRPARQHGTLALSALTGTMDPAALTERELRRPRAEDPSFKVPPGVAATRCLGGLAVARRIALGSTSRRASSAHARVQRARSPPTASA
jgi:hypothetical protein